MPISRTIREQVTCQLRDEVIAGAIAPGAVLRENDLATRFGVSRGPIRDAFLQLSNEGYLAYQANRGVTVRHPPDQSDREFIAELRRQIELHVVTKGVSQVTNDGQSQVEDSLAALHEACLAGDLAAIKRCDLDFHEAILSACGGESLLPAWKQLCSRMILVYDRFSDIGLVHAEHQQIYEAFRSEDLDGLIKALSDNIT
ncbi:putative HTH-type transcriptional regulator YdfH [Planctomycetes bacterium MalM25]|nr:putative HTH-type transcriptional regulator YdfH [Planctomycetes bacterium MalM25]